MSTTLEWRYRRLLSFFPAAHRHVYEEEMIGVLLAAAGDRQRRPRPAEALNLVLTGLRLRLGRWGSGLGDHRWSTAAAVFGLFGAVFLVVRPGEALLAGKVWTARTGMGSGPVGDYTWAWLGGWLAVVVAILLGWRVVAPVLAWALAAVETVRLAGDYAQQPVYVLHALPWLVLELTVAAVLCVPNRRRAALAVLGRRGVIWFAVGSVILLFGPMLDPALARVQQFPDGSGEIGMWPTGGGYFPGLTPLLGGDPFGMGLTDVLVVVVLLVVGLRLLALLDAGIRRRVIVLAATPGLLILTIMEGFGGFEASSPRFDPPVLLEPVQWVVLVLVPLLTLLVGSALVQVLDRRAYLIELGRVADRQPIAPAGPATPPSPDGS